MNTFEQFFNEADQQKLEGRYKFHTDDIVLVNTVLGSGSTKMNKQARSYINQIGVVTGYEPRSMASPYYIVKFDDGNEVPVIALFLRGPFKTIDIAKKFQSNPKLKETAKDVTRPVNLNPIRELEHFERNQQTEQSIAAALPKFIWIKNPILYKNKKNDAYFLIAYLPLGEHIEKIIPKINKDFAFKPPFWTAGKYTTPIIYKNRLCWPIFRKNNRYNKKLIAYNMLCPVFSFDGWRAGQGDMPYPENYILFPFMMDAMEYAGQDLLITKEWDVYNEFVEKVKTPKDYYIYYFLNPSTIERIKNHYKYMEQSRPGVTEQFKQNIMNDLRQNGFPTTADVEDLSDEMMIDLL